MNIKILETFIWAARTQSFTEAARRVNASQPAVSARMKELENNLGVELFERTGSSICLTCEGRELFDYAVKFVADWGDVKSRLGDASTVAGQVRVGVTETIALTWLPDLVARLHLEYPNVELELNVGLTADVWADLNAGRIDVGLLPGPASGPGIKSLFLGKILYTWMASPMLGIPHAVHSPSDLAHWPVVTLSKNSNLYDGIGNWFKKGHAEAKRVSACNSLGVVARLTASGHGISMLPPDIYSDLVENGLLEVIQVEPKIKPMQFVALHKPVRGQFLPKIVADLAREVSTFEGK